MKRKKKGTIPFTPIFKDVIAKSEWKCLKTSSKLIYIYLKSNYNGSNNGEITLTYSVLKEEFSSSTVSVALKELVKFGWVEKARPGGLFRKSTRYKLTLKHDRVFKA